MECADLLIAAGRSTASATWRPAEQWRKAMNVIRACHRLPRLLAFSSTGSYVAIRIHADDDSEPDAADTSSKPAEKISVAADDEDFRNLVKEKRVGCFRRLGGAAGLAKALASGAETGIRGGEEDIQHRRDAFGANTFPKRKPKSFLRHVWDALSDVFLIVLLVCAAVSLGFGIKEHGLKDGWYDGVSIFLVVFHVAGVSAVSNHAQARRFDSLAHASDDVAVAVVRAARRREVSIFDLVVGDVVVLKFGEVVPADGVLLYGHALQVDESSMTGEPHPVHVDAETSPFLASGVKVIDGYGTMLVTAVGTHTAWGEMMRTITRDNTNDPTPLQERLKGLTSSIGKVGVAVAVLVFAVPHFTGSTKDEQGRSVFERSLPITVVAIPEGLPLAVTLTLAFSMKRMVKENALVRLLSACETMGSVTAICTDKTGTLTLNQMKVTEFWVGNERPTASTAIAANTVRLLCQGAGLNTTGSVYRPDNVSPPEVSGSPTEKALLSWACQDGYRRQLALGPRHRHGVRYHVQKRRRRWRHHRGARVLRHVTEAAARHRGPHPRAGTFAAHGQAGTGAALEAEGPRGRGHRRRHERRAGAQGGRRGPLHGHPGHRGRQRELRHHHPKRQLRHGGDGHPMGPLRLQQHTEVHPVPAHRQRGRAGHQLRLGGDHREDAADDGAAAVGEPHHGHHGRAGAGDGHAHRRSHATPAHRPHGAAHQQRHVAQPPRAGRVPGGRADGAAVPRPRTRRNPREGQRHHDLQRLRALPGFQRVQRAGDRAEERLRRGAAEQDVPGRHRRHDHRAGGHG